MNATATTPSPVPSPSLARSVSPLVLGPPRLPLPPITGTIDRRMLVNFRCDPEILARWVPSPFRPRLVRGWGLAGLCLIRLRNLRPRGWPAQIGLSSENAAHRIAVEWDEAGVTRQGVYVLRRDTNSHWNVLAGGRLFPGVHHQADFKVWETPHRLKFTMRSHDDVVRIRVVARLAETWPANSLFPTLAEASAFFASGRLGWSETQKPGAFDKLRETRAEALLLNVHEWAIEILTPERVESSFFDHWKVFPPGSVALDNILLQRGLEHDWHALGCADCGLPENRLEPTPS